MVNYCYVIIQQGRAEMELVGGESVLRRNSLELA